MKTLEKVSDFVGKYMAAIVIVVAALALLFPGTFSVVKTAWVNTLLGIVMFGMGGDWLINRRSLLCNPKLRGS